MTYMKNSIASLKEARLLARTCGYDAVVSYDLSEKNGAKQFYTGPWVDLIREIYNTDMRERWFYEVVFSSPVSEPNGYHVGAGPRPAEDHGMCGARFVMDIDFKLMSSQIDKHVASVASLLEKALEISRKTSQGPGSSNTGRKRNFNEMKVLLNSILTVTSSEEILVRLRMAVKTWVIEGLQQLGFSLEETAVHMLDASSLVPAMNGNPAKLKFSLHLHYNKILIRQHCVDGAILARNLNAVMSASVLNHFINNEPLTEQFWLRCILLQVPDESRWSAGTGFSRQCISDMGIIDESIYSDGRSIRLWLSSKRGQDRPFVRVADDGRIIENRCVDRKTFVLEMAQFRISHIQGSTNNGVPFRGMQFSEQKEFPPIPPTCLKRLNARFAETNSDLSGVTWEDRVLSEEYLSSVWALFQADDPSNYCNTKARENAALSRTIPSKFVGLSSRRILHSTMIIYDDTCHGIPAGELTASAYYHCPTCDCHPRGVIVHENFQSGKPDGNPSANCIVTSDLDLALYCYNCKYLQIVQQILNYRGFSTCTANVTPVDPIQGRYFPSDSLKPIVEASLMKGAPSSLIAVNAGMGSGKTHAANVISRLPGVKSVLVLTHRVALAKSLSQVFSAKNYGDVFETEEMSDYARLVVVVNSLWKIKGHNRYDLVIVDEAGFVRRHFAGGTFPKLGNTGIPYSRRNIISGLSKYCSTASCVVLLQDGLSNEDVQFYCALRKNTRRVHKFYLPPAATPKRYELIDDFYDWLCELHHTVIIRKRKTFVACSRAVDALGLYMFFKRYWKNLRVAMICGDHVEPPVVENAETFVNHYTEYDLCIATSAMETGVSLENHYTDVFAVYRARPISHMSQIQLVNRVRNSSRTVIFASPGTPFSRRQTINLLKRDWDTVTTPSGYCMHLDATDDSLCSALLASIVEDADVRNNNRQLWVLHQDAQTTTSFSFDASQKKNLSKAYYLVASENRKKHNKQFRTIRPGSDPDVRNESDFEDVDVIPSPISTNYPPILVGEDDDYPSDVIMRYTRKRFQNAQDFMSTPTLEVMQAKARLGKIRGGGNKISTENGIHTKAMNSLPFCRRVFIFVALIDHCAALEKCTDPAKREMIAQKSYWSAIEDWITGIPPTNQSDTQNNLKCVLEVLQGTHVTERMFKTFLPAPGLIMWNTPQNVTKAATALKEWMPPKPIVACAPHTLTSPYTCVASDIRGAKGVKSTNFKTRKEKPENFIGIATRRFVSDRVPISLKTIRRGDKPAIIVRPWSCSTLALVASGLLDLSIPGDMQTLSYCDWFFFTEMDKIGESAFKYERPLDESKDAESLSAVDADINKFRAKLDEATRMNLKLSKDRFNKLYRNTTTPETPQG